MAPLLLCALADPMHESVWTAGNFNFTPKGEARLHIATPDAKVDASLGSHFWSRLLQDCTDVTPGDFSHFDAKGDTLNRNDQVFTSVPPWLLAQYSTRAQVIRDPHKLWCEGISDHAPVIAVIGAKLVLPKPQRPIPSFIAKSHEFKAAHDQLCTDARLDSMPIIPRWELHKQIIRQAGEEARNSILVSKAHDPRSRNLLFSSIARAVARQDVALARTNSSRVIDAPLFLRLSGKEVSLVDGASFNSKFCENKLALVSSIREHTPSAVNSKDPYSRALARLERIYAPHGQASKR